MKIVAKIIIEIMGSPKEHVDETVTKVLDELGKRENLNILDKHIAEAKNVEDERLNKFFTSFVEIDIEVESIEDLIGVCFDFMPSSVEIIEPTEFRLRSTQIDDILNDLLDKLHKFSMAVRNMHAENVLLKKQMGKK